MWGEYYNSKQNEEPFSDYANADQKQLNGFLKVMCIYESLPHIKYLLESPLLRIHADFHADNDEAFKCLQNCDLKIIKYLIFDYGLKTNENIEKILDNSDTDFAMAVRNMFKLRDYQVLNTELPANEIKVKKNKV
jgi:hypothetical protein